LKASWLSYLTWQGAVDLRGPEFGINAYVRIVYVADVWAMCMM
jgi:hypothetical protein